MFRLRSTEHSGHLAVQSSAAAWERKSDRARELSREKFGPQSPAAEMLRDILRSRDRRSRTDRRMPAVEGKSASGHRGGNFERSGEGTRPFAARVSRA